MNVKEKTLYSGNLKKQTNSNKESSLKMEPTHFHYFELDLLQMTFGYKKNQEEESLNKIYGFKQIITYSVNLNKEEKSTCMLNHGFSVNLLGGKKYVLFCDTIDEFLDWIEGFKLFFEKKTQKLLKKFIQNEQLLNSSNHTRNENGVSIFNKDKEKYCKFNDLVIHDELSISILGDNINNKLKNKQQNSFTIDKYHSFYICGISSNHNDKLQKESKLNYMNKSLNLFNEFLEKKKTEFIKEVLDLLKKRGGNKKKEEKKGKEDELDDWTIEIQSKKVFQKNFNKENLMKEISKINSTKVNDSDLKLNKSSKIKLYDENDISLIEKCEDSILSPIYQQSITQKNTEVEFNIELIDKEISSKVDFKREKFIELDEDFADFENKIIDDNQSVKPLKEYKNILDQKHNTNEKLGNIIDQKLAKKLNIKNSQKEEDKQITQKFNENNQNINKKKEKELIKLDSNINNNDSELKLEYVSKYDLSKIESKMNTSSKNIEGTSKASNINKNVNTKQNLNLNKIDLSISGFSDRNFPTINSPQFGNISIITQKLNKIDNIDDWKEYVNINHEMSNQKKR